MGDEIIASEDLFEVEDALKALLLERLGEPGGAAPAASAAAPSATPTPLSRAPTTAIPRVAPIHLATIDKEGCDTCSRAFIVIESLQDEYPQMALRRFDNVRDADLIEAMGKHLGLSQDHRLIAPSIYVGNDALVGSEITSDNLRELLASYSASGAPAFWEGLDTEAGKESILVRFRSMGPLAVVLAALVDGINPCAFATIIFFVSYLVISRRQRSALLAVGLAFTTGVFLTYLLVGLGAMSLLKWASAMRIVGLILYGLMALSCFVLAGVSVHDYLLARQGKLHEMRLNLPGPLRERIKGRIRAGSGAFMGTAFVSGLVVSLLELACTGQVYLPTISFVVGIPEMRAYAVAYLVLYNVVFVIPLLVVLFLAAYGVSATRFQNWFVQNAAKAKLTMAVLFLLLGLLLLTQVLGL